MSGFFKNSQMTEGIAEAKAAKVLMVTHGHCRIELSVPGGSAVNLGRGQLHRAAEEACSSFTGVCSTYTFISALSLWLSASAGPGTYQESWSLQLSTLTICKSLFVTSLLSLAHFPAALLLGWGSS